MSTQVGRICRTFGILFNYNKALAKRKEVSLKLLAKPNFCNSNSTGITQSLGSGFG